ncbi:MAG: enoyl-CoA hydratase/isomerase family protein [Chloroflexi bacterium]|nr:enoyl-CoA hydratase/isomerase family protein [Chloroflexota bacterium]
MASYKFRHLLTQSKDKVLTVTLNRPEVLNAVNHDMHLELEDFFRLAKQDSDTNVIVVTGAGRAFCAGGDIKDIQKTDTHSSARLQDAMKTGPGLIRALLEVEQPVIAAVNGDAVGLGATLALFCDIVMASERARIADTHIRVAAVAGDGGAVIWPLLMPLNRAKEFLMTGDFISAKEAERLGLVNHVVPHEDLMSSTYALAERLAKGPAVGIRWTKLALNQWLIDAMNRMLPLSIALEALSFTTQDYLEAVQAFVQKRPPQFKGT